MCRGTHCKNTWPINKDSLPLFAALGTLYLRRVLCVKMIHDNNNNNNMDSKPSLLWKFPHFIYLVTVFVYYCKLINTHTQNRNTCPLTIVCQTAFTIKVYTNKKRSHMRIAATAPVGRRGTQTQSNFWLYTGKIWPLCFQMMEVISLLILRNNWS